MEEDYLERMQREREKFWESRGVRLNRVHSYEELKKLRAGRAVVIMQNEGVVGPVLYDGLVHRRVHFLRVVGDGEDPEIVSYMLARPNENGFDFDGNGRLFNYVGICKCSFRPEVYHKGDEEFNGLKRKLKRAGLVGLAMDPLEPEKKLEMPRGSEELEQGELNL